MDKPLITLSGGPADQLRIQVSTSTTSVEVPGDGYDVWRYTRRSADPSAPWVGELHRSPLGHSE
jgi:hypothetical protein